MHLSDSTIAEINGMSLRGLRPGKTVLYVETENRYLRDSAEIAVTEWFSGVSTLRIVDSLPDFFCTSMRGDTVFGFREFDRVPQNTLVSLDQNFDLLQNIKTFESVPNWMLNTSFGSFVMTKKATPMTPKKLYKYNLNREWKVVNDTFPRTSGRPPDSYVLFQGWDYDSSGNVYIAEYLSEDSLFPAYSVHLFKSSDKGETWAAAYTFPPRNVPGIDGGVRHVHTIARDPYQGFLWLSTGDNHHQSRIYYHENKLLPDTDGVVRLKLLGNLREEFKAVSFFFTANHIYWCMDSPTDTQKIYRIPRMSTYPTISPANDYRELVGTFRDKAFWQNARISLNGEEAFLLETCYEKDYAPMIDRRSRIFLLKENPEFQVQEIFAARSYGNYAHFYPRGQLSDGSLVFSGLRAVNPRTTVFKARLEWSDVESGEAVSKSPSLYKFSRHLISLSGDFNGEGKLFACTKNPQTLPVMMPDTLSPVAGSCFEFFSSTMNMTRGYIYANLTISPSHTDSLRWFYLDNALGKWIDLGCTKKGGAYFNSRPLPELGIVVLAKTVPPAPTTTGENRETDFSVFNLYPNPFNPVCNIRFSLVKPGKVLIEVYSVLGTLVQTLAENNFTEGTHTLQWAPEYPLSSGMYFIELTGEGGSRKVVKAVFAK